ncbi:RNA polymerase sigma-70 region 2 [Vibrio phage 177E37-1]|nr:RNA polymerase sigma-70 region 2 [Vibrio phage 177E37-1]
MDFKSTLESSYRENYKKWFNRMKGGNVTNEMAEDIIQLACVNALEHQEAYDSTRPFDNWFEWILNNARITIINQDRNGGMVGRSL